MKSIIRTCIITRANDFKSNLFRFVLKSDNQYIYDEKQKLDGRGIYIVKDLKVFEKFLKRYKLDLISSEKILKELKNSVTKTSDEILKPLLASLKNSEYIIYGLDDNIEGIKSKRVKLLIIPSDINVKTINKLKKIANIFETRIIFLKTKNTLKEIFLNEVSVIGVINKKVVNGIINKMEVEK